MHPSIALLLTAVVVLANAFFVASEFAFVKIRPTRLEQLAAEGSARARLLLGITQQLAGLPVGQPARDHPGVADAGLAGGAGHRAVLRPCLVAPAWRAPTLHTLAATISLILITFLHTVLGELAPKALAIQRTEPVALWAAVPFRAFYMVSFPVNWTLKAAAGLVLRILRPAARVGGGDAALARGAAAGLAARAAGAGGPTPHRPRVRLHAPGGAARDDLAAGRRDADRWGSLRREPARGAGEPVHALPAGRAGHRSRGRLHPSQGHRGRASPPASGPSGCGRSSASRSTPRRTRGSSGCGASSSGVASTSPSSSGRSTLSSASSRWRTWSRRCWARFRTSRTPARFPPSFATRDGSFEVDGRLTLDVASRDLGVVFPPVPPQIETLGGFVITQLPERAVPGDDISAANFRFTVLDVRDGRIRRLHVEPLPPNPNPAKAELRVEGGRASPDRAHRGRFGTLSGFQTRDSRRGRAGFARPSSSREAWNPLRVPNTTSVDVAVGSSRWTRWPRRRRGARYGGAAPR